MAVSRSPGPETTAVLVTCGTTRYLRRTLEGVRAQSVLPTRVVVVDIWSSGRDLGTGQSIQAIITELGLDDVCTVRVLQAPQARTFGDAVRRGLELNALAQQRADKLHETRTGEIPVIRDDTSPGWLWLLHDDSAPEPGALEHLLRAAESAPSVAVAGAKQRDWDEPDRLLEVGIHATASARRFNPIDDDEIDQGQHDSAEDVLAVGLAGALVRRDVWGRLGGPDPALGPFGDGLEFCRRARLAGHRVIVVPPAVVHHARASYLGMRSYGHASQPDLAAEPARSFGARRRAQLYNWVIAVPALRLPFLLVWLLVLTPVRALIRFAQKDMVRSRAELTAGAAVLSRPDLWLAARKRLRTTSVLPVRTLAGLEVSAREIRRKKREQRRVRAAGRTLRSAPSELELAERAALAGRRRLAATGVAAGAVGVAVAGLAPLLGQGALTGGALLPGDVTVGELAEVAFSWWIPTGDGVPGPPDPFLVSALLPMLTGASLSAVSTAVVLLAVPGAALTAWFAAGAATRSNGLRAWAAALWAFAPVTLVATGQGRVGALVAHVGLPLVALLTARALGVARKDVPGAPGTGTPGTPPDRGMPSLGAAARAALVLAVVVAAAPALLPGALLVFGALTLVSRQRRTVWFIPVPALAVLGPYLTGVVTERSWHALAAGPGVPLPFTAAEPWQVLLGLPVSVDVAAPPPWLPWLALVPGAVVTLLAVLALGRGTGRARAVRAGWAVALVGLATAFAAERIAVAVDEAGEIVRGWPGPGISLLSLGLLIAAVSAADGLRAVLSRRSFGPRQLASALSAVLAGTAAVVAAGVWVAGLRGPEVQLLVAAPAAVVPALSDQVADSPDRSRTLALLPEEEGVSAHLWRSRGAQLQHTSTLAAARLIADPLAGTAAGPAENGALAEVVAGMVAGSATDAGQRLAAHAVAVVLVPPVADAALAPTRDALVAALDATPGLARVAETEAGVVWRVATDGRDGAAQAVARLRLEDHDGLVLTALEAGTLGATGDLPAGPAGRVLVLAERSAADWRATVDGVPLAAIERDWRQAFAVPEGGGRYAVTYEPPLRRPWFAVQGVVGAATVLLALPMRRRREGE